MKPAPFDYARVTNTAEAVAALSRDEGGAKLIAGGQSLVPMLNLRLAPVDLLVDIGGIAELRQSQETGDAVGLGACVTHAEIEDGAAPDPARGLMRRVAGGIAYRAIRNAGTIGGSLALADPSAEWPVTLLALGAKVETLGPAGARTIPVETFLLGAYTTALAENELITRIAVPRVSPEARWGVFKLCRKTGEFATSVAVVVIDAGRGVRRIALGGTGGAPLLLERTAATLDGKAWSLALADRIAEAVRAELAATDRGFDAFALQVHAASIVRAAREALA
jgi:carbon-monoxide dehydrogenase medium subunit